MLTLPDPPHNPVLHIAVGVLIDAGGRVLIAQRRAGTPGAGKWEFPGGKREANESIQAALARELDEELGIQVQQLRPMLRFHHDYADRRVLLDVWRVLEWRGQPVGREGQIIAWCAPLRLMDYDLLSANKPIVDAIRLPDGYVISPEPGADCAAFLQAASTAAARGARLLRLRALSLDDAAYETLAHALKARLQEHGTALMLDRGPEMLARVGAAGLHLPARAAQRLSQRPVPNNLWFAVSCHSRQALVQARRLGADFAVLSPVKPTASHPQSEPLGWHGFAQASDDVALPVFALGGLTPDDCKTAWANGAQGVAGINAFWPRA